MDEEKGARRRSGAILVDIIAWTAAIVFCLGLPAAVGLVAFKSLDGAMKARKAETVAVAGRRPPCTTPELTQARYQALRDAQKAAGPGADDRPPAWLRRPAPTYPQAMFETGEKEGSVRIGCEIAEDGAVRACRILNETPTGAGLADAVLTGMCDARFQPRTVDGRPRTSLIHTTIHFRAP